MHFFLRLYPIFPRKPGGVLFASLEVRRLTKLLVSHGQKKFPFWQSVKTLFCFWPDYFFVKKVGNIVFEKFFEDGSKLPTYFLFCWFYNWIWYRKSPSANSLKKLWATFVQKLSKVNIIFFHIDFFQSRHKNYIFGLDNTIIIHAENIIYKDTSFVW